MFFFYRITEQVKKISYKILLLEFIFPTLKNVIKLLKCDYAFIGMFPQKVIKKTLNNFSSFLTETVLNLIKIIK